MFKRGSVAVVAAGLVLALAGCDGGTDGADQRDDDTSDKRPAGTTPTRPPSKELVNWLGGMCESTTALKNLRTDSAADLKEIRNWNEDDLPAGALAVGYVSGTKHSVESVQGDLENLGQSGVPAADRLLDAWLTKVNGVVAELDELWPVALADADGNAEEVDQHVQTLTPPTPDLLALTKQDLRLAPAYQRAKQCTPGWKPDKPTASPEPTGPLPKAADGTNTKACSDGACEILVTSTADITANGVSVHISVGDSSVSFRSGGAVMQFGGAGGKAGFGNRLTANVVAHNKDGAVVKFY